MLTYVVLNLMVIGAFVVFWWFKPLTLPWRRIAALCVLLLVMTALFDSLIISAHVVDYNVGHLLGVYIGKAPIEDFAYTIVVSVLVPYLWLRSDNK